MYTCRLLTTSDANALCSFRDTELQALSPSIDTAMLPTESRISFFLKEMEEAQTRVFTGCVHEGGLVAIGVVAHYGRNKGEWVGYVGHQVPARQMQSYFCSWMQERWPEYCIIQAAAADGCSVALASLREAGFANVLLEKGLLREKMRAG